MEDSFKLSLFNPLILSSQFELIHLIPFIIKLNHLTCPMCPYAKLEDGANNKGNTIVTILHSAHPPDPMIYLDSPQAHLEDGPNDEGEILV